LADKVDAIAAQLERPRGWVVNKALAAWVEEPELRDRLTREAMDEADRGLLIDDDEVKAWMASLSTPNPLPLPKP
jgi:predicted transcriptional regulator